MITEDEGIIVGGNGANARRVDGILDAVAFVEGMKHDDGEEEEIVGKLFRIWRNERSSPELQDSPYDIVDEVLELIDFQSNRVVESSTEPSNTSTSRAFLDCIYQMDLERVKFVLKSLIRCRLGKIERNWAGFWATWNPSGAAGELAKLSLAEREYLESFSGALVEAMQEAALSRLPPDLASLQDPDMLDGPNGATPVFTAPSLSSHVICRVRRSIGEIVLDPLTRATAALEPNDVFVLQYEVIREFLNGGEVELI